MNNAVLLCDYFAADQTNFGRRSMRRSTSNKDEIGPNLFDTDEVDTSNQKFGNYRDASCFNTAMQPEHAPVTRNDYPDRFAENHRPSPPAQYYGRGASAPGYPDERNLSPTLKLANHHLPESPTANRQPFSGYDPTHGTPANSYQRETSYNQPYSPHQEIKLSPIEGFARPSYDSRETMRPQQVTSYDMPNYVQTSPKMHAVKPTINHIPPSVFDNPLHVGRDSPSHFPASYQPAVDYQQSPTSYHLNANAAKFSVSPSYEAANFPVGHAFRIHTPVTFSNPSTVCADAFLNPTITSFRISPNLVNGFAQNPADDYQHYPVSQTEVNVQDCGNTKLLY